MSIKESFDEYATRTRKVLAQLDWDAERQAIISRQAQLASAIAALGAEPVSGDDDSKSAFKKKLTELEQLQNALKITVVYKMKPVPSHVRAALGK